MNFDTYSFWLLARSDNLYNAGGGVLATPAATYAGSRHVAIEYDLTLRYRLGASTIGAGVGYGRPVDFLRAQSSGAPSAYPFLFWIHALTK